MAKLVFGILLLCGGLIAMTIGGYMAKDGWDIIKKPKKNTPPPSLPNVSSTNQSGGITAGTINTFNVTNIQRSLPADSCRSKLSQFSNAKIYLHWQADDNETVLFKNNIYQCLSNAGLQVTQSAGHSNDSSIQNLILDINMGHPDNSNAVLVAEILKSIFDENNIKSRIYKNSDNLLAENEMYIRIGAMQ